MLKPFSSENVSRRNNNNNNQDDIYGAVIMADSAPRWVVLWGYTRL